MFKMISFEENNIMEVMCLKPALLKWLFTSKSDHIKMFVNFEVVKQYKNTYLQFHSHGN